MLQQVIHCACSFADPLIKVLMMRYCMLICFDVIHDLCKMSVTVILLHVGGLTAGYASALPAGCFTCVFEDASSISHH